MRIINFSDVGDCLRAVIDEVVADADVTVIAVMMLLMSW